MVCVLDRRLIRFMVLHQDWSTPLLDSYLKLRTVLCKPAENYHG